MNFSNISYLVYGYCSNNPELPFNTEYIQTIKDLKMLKIEKISSTLISKVEKSFKTSTELLYLYTELLKFKLTYDNFAVKEKLKEIEWNTMKPYLLNREDQDSKIEDEVEIAVKLNLAYIYVKTIASDEELLGFIEVYRAFLGYLHTLYRNKPNVDYFILASNIKISLALSSYWINQREKGFEIIEDAINNFQGILASNPSLNTNVAFLVLHRLYYVYSDFWIIKKDKGVVDFSSALGKLRSNIVNEFPQIDLVILYNIIKYRRYTNNFDDFQPVYQLNQLGNESYNNLEQKKFIEFLLDAEIHDFGQFIGNENEYIVRFYEKYTLMDILEILEKNIISIRILNLVNTTLNLVSECLKRQFFKYGHEHLVDNISDVKERIIKISFAQSSSLSIELVEIIIKFFKTQKNELLNQLNVLEKKAESFNTYLEPNRFDIDIYFFKSLLMIELGLEIDHDPEIFHKGAISDDIKDKITVIKDLLVIKGEIQNKDYQILTKLSEKFERYKDLKFTKKSQYSRFFVYIFVSLYIEYLSYKVSFSHLLQKENDLKLTISEFDELKTKEKIVSNNVLTTIIDITKIKNLIKVAKYTEAHQEFRKLERDSIDLLKSNALLANEYEEMKIQFDSILKQIGIIEKNQEESIKDFISYISRMAFIESN